MKVAHLITGLGMGGAERQLKALVTDQGNPFLSHIVISLKDEGIIGRQLASQPGVRLYCLNLQKSMGGGLGVLSDFASRETGRLANMALSCGFNRINYRKTRPCSSYRLEYPLFQHGFVTIFTNDFRRRKDADVSLPVS